MRSRWFLPVLLALTLTAPSASADHSLPHACADASASAILIVDPATPLHLGALVLGTASGIVCPRATLALFETCSLITALRDLAGLLAVVSDTAGPPCWTASARLDPLTGPVEALPGGGFHGAPICEQAGPGRGSCTSAMTGNGSVSSFFTETSRSCILDATGQETCDIMTRTHLIADSALPGRWSARAKGHVHDAVSGHVPGSERELSCAFDILGPGPGSCSTSGAGPTIRVGPGLQLTWIADWELWYTDIAGSPHLQARGSSTGPLGG